MDHSGNAPPVGLSGEDGRGGGKAGSSPAAGGLGMTEGVGFVHTGCEAVPLVVPLTWVSAPWVFGREDVRQRVGKRWQAPRNSANGEITAGQPSPPLTARVPVVAQLGAASVNPSYAGLAPGFAGLYQVNLTVPSELPTGTHKLRISAKENLSNTVDLSVRSTVR